MIKTDYFQRLTALLKQEKEEDLLAYLNLTQSSNAATRRSEGLCWYPLAIRSTEMSRGEYLTVELERTTHHDVAHQFRFGMPAALFSNHRPDQDRIEGVIAYQGGNRLKLSLKTDELPDWASEGKLGIDLLFDNNSYQEMEKALRQADALDNTSPSWPMHQVLTGQRKATQTEPAAAPHLPILNPSQQRAVNLILSANELAIVHGPPGTGKTTTLVQAVKALAMRDKRQLLVVAPSNTAVDLLSMKLVEAGLSVLRIGNPARVSEELMALTLDQKLSAHPEMKDIKKLKKRAAEYKSMAHQYKRHFGRAEKEQRKALFDEAHQLMKQVERTEQYLMEQLMDQAQVITATLVGANHYSIRQRQYHTVIIDEAGQALEPACWIPLLKAERVVFAGDHCQLSPTIKSAAAMKGGLGLTLFEKCVQAQPEAVVLLEEQYRMHESIMAFSSRMFYGGQLQAHSSVANHRLYAGDQPFLFIDTAGCGFEEQLQGTSTTNAEEASFLLKHLSQLYSTLMINEATASLPTVGIISPYKQQVSQLKEQLLASPALEHYHKYFTVNTIDSFQGQERDVIYISLTRSNAEGQIGFLSDVRRMNVALTRARKKLVVIGDSATLSRFPFYADFIQYAGEIGAHQSAWEYMDA